MTSEQDLLSALAKTAFRLNGRLLAVGEELAASAGLTASLWLVLGSVLDAPRTVADIARDIGVTRQSATSTARSAISGSCTFERVASAAPRTRYAPCGRAARAGCGS